MSIHTRINKMREFKLLIDGVLVPGTSVMAVLNPATGAVIAESPVADEAQLDGAVSAAGRAFRTWAATSWAHRQRLLGSLADALDGRALEFAELLTSEQGKPLRNAKAEVAGSAKRIRELAGLEILEQVREATSASRIMDQVLPLGVVAVITPWNFPLALLVNKLAPALVAGNCVVIKPAPTTPLTTLLLGELCSAIFPAGVVNVIADRNDLGQRMTEHPDIAKVSFTGSTATGRRVMAGAAGSIKRITLELGGNDAALVLEDADAKDAAGKVFAGAMVNSGQVCVAIKRVYVPDSLYEEFNLELTRLADATVVGDGMDPASQLGPVQNRAQFERVNAMIIAASKHGRVLAGGAPLDRPGYFIPPTIVAELDDSSSLVSEEQFGPVLPVLRYGKLDDAIDRINSSPYALGATIWTTDPAWGAEVASRVHAGTVWVNHHMAMRHDVPFRGLKQSGFGAELGMEGLEEFVQHRIVNVRL
ncbi:MULTISPECIES: aldehyde dehydrogenase family protein [unclassified Variovorax]|uniref:aldehyde dehydrogenase family protein n=1 Tax=unclassified Variovorax TaxID=663243 RepID=UPI003F4589F5